jgi:hypothetical protein
MGPSQRQVFKGQGGRRPAPTNQPTNIASIVHPAKKGKFYFRMPVDFL